MLRRQFTTAASALRRQSATTSNDGTATVFTHEHTTASPTPASQPSSSQAPAPKIRYGGGPNLHAIAKTWHKMPKADQDNIVQYLESKMAGDWRDLTEEERKAIWFISYGPWGPRDTEASSHTDSNVKVYTYITYALATAFASLFGYKLLE